MKYYFLVVLILIFQMISNVLHLFISLLAICMISWERCLFWSLGHFKIMLFYFLLLSCISFLYILDVTPYQIYGLQIFSPIQRLPLTLLIASFAGQKLFSLMQSDLSTSFLLLVLLVSYSKSCCQEKCQKSFPL